MNSLSPRRRRHIALIFRGSRLRGDDKIDLTEKPQLTAFPSSLWLKRWGFSALGGLHLMAECVPDGLRALARGAGKFGVPALAEVSNGSALPDP